MKVLFDQGTPVPLRTLLAGHTVETVYERGWSKLSNGDLLTAAQAFVRRVRHHRSESAQSAEPDGPAGCLDRVADDAVGADSPACRRCRRCTGFDSAWRISGTELVGQDDGKTLTEKIGRASCRERGGWWAEDW